MEEGDHSLEMETLESDRLSSEPRPITHDLRQVTLLF